jgi:predicted phage tail protein
MGDQALMDEVAAEIKAVCAKLEEVEAEIKAQAQAQAQAQAEHNNEEVAALRKKEEQLRTKEEQLRTKEEQLRTKELILLQRQPGALLS